MTRTYPNAPIYQSKSKVFESCMSQGADEVWQQTLSPFPKTKVKFTMVVSNSSSQPLPLLPIYLKNQITFNGHGLWRYSNYFCIMEVFKLLF